MSNQKLFDYLSQEANWIPLQTNLQEISDIVLEEEGLKWIPVSERLPEETDVYIATVVNRNIDPPFVQEVKYNAQYKDWNTFFKVIAWMLKPKPYQPNP